MRYDVDLAGPPRPTREERERELTRQRLEELGYVPKGPSVSQAKQEAMRGQVIPAQRPTVMVDKPRPSTAKPHQRPPPPGRSYGLSEFWPAPEPEAPEMSEEESNAWAREKLDYLLSLVRAPTGPERDREEMRMWNEEDAAHRSQLELEHNERVRRAGILDPEWHGEDATLRGANLRAEQELRQRGQERR